MNQPLALQPTFGELAEDYIASPQFAAKAPRTQREYRNMLRRLVVLIGDMPLARLGSDVGIEYVYALQERWKEHPRNCNHILAVLSLVCSFGVRRRRLLRNPVIGVERLPTKPRRAVWTFDDQQRFLAVADDTMKLAFLLALYTAQRQGDCLAMRWSQYDGQRITLTQRKTGVTVAITTMDVLRDALDRHPRRGEHILLDHRDRPFRQRQFIQRWTDTQEKAGITGVRFQDLRRTAMTRMGEASVTETEMAAVSGHSIERSRQILETYVVTTTPMAESAVRKWAAYEKALIDKQDHRSRAPGSPADQRA